MSDVLGQLLEFKWRDISFPTTGFSMSVAHDLKQHKWPDRDGAHVEATGRQPIVHHAQVPFRNGIKAAKSESWGLLYPYTFRLFLVAFTTRTSGILQHPELGEIRCKPDKAEFKWSANTRDGVDVSASWIESLDDTVTEFQDILARPSPAQDVALDLDDQLGQYTNPGLPSHVRAFSFVDGITKITSAVSGVTLVAKQKGGYINHVLYRAQLLQDAVLRLRDNTAWPIVMSCERMKAALYTMAKTLLVVARTVAVYTTPKAQTLSSLMVPTRTSVVDLITLNPELAASPVVPKGTAVRYYVAA